jgi:hypothetical protein
MKTKLNPLALGAAGAVISVVAMLLLSILGNMGYYLGAVEMMIQWHMFFNLSFIGIIAGMIEAAVISFVLLYAFALSYNLVNKV